MNFKRKISILLALFTFICVPREVIAAVSNSVTEVEEKYSIDVSKYNPIVEPMFVNEAFKNAWNDYQRVIKNVLFKNIYNNESSGTSVAEFEKIMNSSIEPVKSESTNREIIVTYRYKSKEPFQAEISGDLGTADLVAIFKNDKLYYLGLINYSFLIRQSSLLNQDLVKENTKEPFEFEKLQNDDVITLTFGTLVVNNNQYSIIAIPSGTVDNPVAEYFALVKGKLDYVTTTGINIVLDDNLNKNLEVINDYIVNDSKEFYKIKNKKN